MSRKEKMLDRLLSMSTDFTWDEAVAVMKHYDFVIVKPTGGSGRKFVHKQTRLKVSIHKPHPGNIVKPYAMEDLIQALRNVGAIS